MKNLLSYKINQVQTLDLTRETESMFWVETSRKRESYPKKSNKVLIIE